MTDTPTDTAKLADEIEALAKKYQDAWDYIRAIPRDCQIPFDKMMELESAERAITRACMDKSATIIAALRELEAVKDDVDRLHKLATDRFEEIIAVKAENAKLRDYEALAKAAARWSHPERRQPHCAVTAEEMLSAIWHHPSRAALGGAG